MLKITRLRLITGFVILFATSCTMEWTFNKKEMESAIIESEVDTIHYTYTVYIDSFEMRDAEYPTVFYDYFNVGRWGSAQENLLFCDVSDMAIADSISKTEVVFLGAYLDHSRPQRPFDLVVPSPTADDPNIYVVDTVYEHRIRGINYAIFAIWQDGIPSVDTAYYGNDNFRFYQTMCCHDDMCSVVDMYVWYLKEEESNKGSERAKLFNEWVESSYKLPVQFYGEDLYLLDIFAFDRELSYSYTVFYLK